MRGVSAAYPLWSAPLGGVGLARGRAGGRVTWLTGAGHGRGGARATWSKLETLRPKKLLFAPCDARRGRREWDGGRLLPDHATTWLMCALGGMCVGRKRRWAAAAAGNAPEIGSLLQNIGNSFIKFALPCNDVGAIAFCGAWRRLGSRPAPLAALASV